MPGVRQFVGMLTAQGALRLYRRERHRGFELVNAASPESYALLRQKLDQGLDLVEHFDPVRFAQIQRSLKRFVFIPGGGDHYSRALSAHMVDASGLPQQTNLQTALVIVHEATHARLERSGIAMTAANAARVEHICVKAQVTFVRRIPGTEQTAEDLLRTLNTQWWGPEEAKRRQLRRLQVAGCPDWLTRVLAFPERLRGFFKGRRV